MAMNLRLTPEMATALQAEAERTGQSQQEIARDALGHRLHLIDNGGPGNERQRARADFGLLPARQPYRRVTPRLRLPKGTTSLDLLDRDDRF
ncbi:hypothetical protein PWY87_19160 [Kribbella solani]|uniref:hypothetical protein n=1 Tax=Kribbella solani TaxID=236067 RepID=UPI0029A1F667|nr:hypothetical protein [Kribbella solani]MDX2973635.1 hypothetical protein [Kribbella solani]MDX3003816.1 hypothetical protein [Kribbella solani]